MDFTLDACGIAVECRVLEMGNDLVVTLQGGDAGHVGSTAMALPRESLTGTGRSATTSTLNRMGHKDDFLANPLAHALAARLDCAVVCVAGVHVDGATSAQIAAIQGVVDEAAQRICAWYEEAHHA